MVLVPLTSNTNRPIDAASSDVKDVQQNVVPQELFAAKCTPRGFMVLPKVVRVGPRSGLWTSSGTWTNFSGGGIIEDSAERRSSTTNDFIEITISARCFRLIFLGRNDRGIAGIKIDGSNPSTISGVTMEDGSTALDTLDLYRVAVTDRLFFGYKGLSAAAHTIRITVTGTKNAASTGVFIGVHGIEYVDTLCDASASAACNQVFVLPVGDREGLVDPGDTAAIAYVGAWTTVNSVNRLMGRGRESTTAGDFLEITFNGTGIILLFSTQVAGGFLDITVDGALVQKRWTTYHQTTAHFNYRFPILGLASASHTVRVTVNAANENGANNTVTFDGFFVVKDADIDGYGGVLLTAERRFNKTGLDTVTLAAADSSNPRKDLLVINKSGVFSIIQGTAAASPSEPAVPTDDRVPLAVLTQAAQGVLLERFHAGDLTGANSENNDTVLRYVQDRRRGIISAFDEVPLGIASVNGGADGSGIVLPQVRLPRGAKFLRVTASTVIQVVGASPALQRDLGAATDGLINVNGLGGKIIQATTADKMLISVM